MVACLSAEPFRSKSVDTTNLSTLIKINEPITSDKMHYKVVAIGGDDCSKKGHESV